MWYFYSQLDDYIYVSMPHKCIDASHIWLTCKYSFDSNLGCPYGYVHCISISHWSLTIITIAVAKNTIEIRKQTTEKQRKKAMVVEYYVWYVADETGDTETNT